MITEVAREACAVIGVAPELVRQDGNKLYIQPNEYRRVHARMMDLAAKAQPLPELPQFEFYMDDPENLGWLA